MEGFYRISCFISKTVWWISMKFRMESTLEVLGKGKVKVKKGKVLPVPSYTSCHEYVLGKWRYSSTHSLTSAPYRGGWSVSCPGRFVPRERTPRYPLDRRLGGLQSRCGDGVEEKNSQPPITEFSFGAYRWIITPNLHEAQTELHRTSQTRMTI
jgi:hypothetical protein